MRALKKGSLPGFQTLRLGDRLAAEDEARLAHALAFRSPVVSKPTLEVYETDNVVAFHTITARAEW